MFDSVKHLPRHHLGSTLYQTTVIPISDDPEDESKYGFTSTPVPIPRFAEKENCTFTIRVPRLHLQRNARGEICERRALWGTEIYTDDSDPVAIAIHSGWLRGEWDDDIDISALDLGDVESAKAKARELSLSKEPTITLTETPSFPMFPVPKRDLHITLLILPPLASYASHNAYGLTSREWSTPHDGMSVKIEKMAWVDESASKGEERGGAARRKRMRALEESQKGNLGPKISMSFGKGAEGEGKEQAAKAV